MRGPSARFASLGMTSLTLVPKLHLGTAMRARTKLSFEDKVHSQVQLGNEETDDAGPRPESAIPVTTSEFGTLHSRRGDRSTAAMCLRPTLSPASRHEKRCGRSRRRDNASRRER